jgi:hypothetical protein
MRNMLKVGTTALAVVAGLAIGASTTQSANAATWHKGTPKVLRGKWVDPKKDKTLDYYPWFTIKSNALLLPFVTNKNMTYQHKKGSHVYYIKGHEMGWTHGKLVNYYKFKVSKTNRKHKSYKAQWYGYKQTGESVQTSPNKHPTYGHVYYK